MSPEQQRLAAAIYGFLDAHGWAEHYQCGWDNGGPADPMCGKEWVERQSIAELVEQVIWPMTRGEQR